MNAPTCQGLTILDPGLFFEGGHHASIARTLADRAEYDGIYCEVWGLAQIDNPPEGLQIRRHFRTSAYAPISDESPYDDLLRHNDAIHHDLRSAERIIGTDTVFLPTITSRMALGVARWLSDRDSALPQTCSMMLMFPPGFGGKPAVCDAETRIYRDAMTLLRHVPGDRLSLFAETPSVARVFESLGAPRVRPLAWPVTVRGKTEAVRDTASPIIANVGYSKAERGFSLLPGVINATKRAHPSSRFIVQANFWNDPVLDRTTAQLDAAPATVLIRGPMPPDEYASVLGMADIVLLPYDSTAYRERGSGVFVESASLGRVLVLPANTWIAEQAAASGLGVVEFASFSDSSVTDALLEAIGRRDELRTRAERAAHAWNDERSPGRFIEMVSGGPARESRTIGGAA